MTIRMVIGVVAVDAGTNQVGKRYACKICGSEVICVKSGAGRITCHESTMELRVAKPLPSSD